MNLKQFLKPDWRKIGIFIIFVIIFELAGFVIAKFNLIGYYGLIIPSPRPLRTDAPIEVGFPFVFYVPEFQWGPLYSPEKFYFFPLILNVIFYYLFSCFIIWIWDKLKKKF